MLQLNILIILCCVNNLCKENKISFKYYTLLNFKYLIVIYAKVMYGREKLFYDIFNINDYKKMVRPFGENDLTYVETELKLLQIDLV